MHVSIENDVLLISLVLQNVLVVPIILFMCIYRYICLLLLQDYTLYKIYIYIYIICTYNISIYISYVCTVYIYKAWYLYLVTTIY